MRELLKYYNCKVTLEYYEPLNKYHAFVSFKYSTTEHDNVDVNDPTFLGLMRKLDALKEELDKAKDA